MFANEDSLVVLVDDKDNELGSCKKIEAHTESQLHRAFSVFLYHGDSILLQKRAKDKYHSGGLWSNTCCSHPEPGEKVLIAARRRLKEELDIDFDSLSDLIDLGTFLYHFDFENKISENELDHVLIGRYEGLVNPDPDEVDDVRWVSISEIKKELEQDPGQFTCWFPKAFDIASERIESLHSKVEVHADWVDIVAGNDLHKVRLLLHNTGRGLVGCLTGGDSPHLGGVVLAVPRLSISGSGESSCDINCITVPSHLDNEVGRIVAEILCRAQAVPVSISSGIHIDGASMNDIDVIRDNCLVAADMYLNSVVYKT